MGLEALLATLEARRADTPDTPCNSAGVSRNPAPIGACTLDTPDTPEIIDGKGIAPASHWWLIHYPDREPLEVACYPDATHAELLERHPDAVAAEPIKQPMMEPARACTSCVHVTGRGGCGEPVMAGLSNLPGVIRYHPRQGDGCPAWRHHQFGRATAQDENQTHGTGSLRQGFFATEKEKR